MTAAGRDGASEAPGRVFAGVRSGLADGSTRLHTRSGRRSGGMGQEAPRKALQAVQGCRTQKGAARSETSS
jgi:hypothetical protein